MSNSSTPVIPEAVAKSGRKIAKKIIESLTSVTESEFITDSFTDNTVSETI